VNLQEKPVIQTNIVLVLPQFVSRNNVATSTLAKLNERRLFDEHLHVSCDGNNCEIFS